MEIDLARVDEHTFHYANLLRGKLSAQERKVIAAIAREVVCGSVTAKNVREISRIYQTNQVHTILGRLCKKGFLEKLERSSYRIIDKDLAIHLLVRTTRICQYGASSRKEIVFV